ncbi:MAG: hypothetical protein AAGA99_19970 [Actinomycetota bacterium]
MQGGDEELDDFERRLHASLHGRSDRVQPSPYAYRSVLRRAERDRRARTRRRLAIAGTAATVAIAVPVGVAVFASDPAQVISSAPADEDGLPRLQPAEVPNGFELTEVVDVEPVVGGEGEDDYVQVFRPVGRDGRVVARQSSLPPNALVPPADATQVDVNGSQAWLTRIDGERATLTWVDNQTQTVRELYGRNFSDAELQALASSLRRRIDGLGFDTSLLPSDITVVSEGELPDDEQAAQTALRWARDVPGADGSIDLRVREGSALELELIRVNADGVLEVNVGGIRRLLVTEESAAGDVYAVYWSVGDAIVEVRSEGLSQSELLDVASSIESIGEDGWDAVLADARDLDVVISSGEDPAADAAPSAPTVPQRAVESIIDGTPWRLSWPISPVATGETCLTLQLGATDGEHCILAGAEVVAFPLGEITALVVAAPGDEVVAVTMAGEVLTSDGEVEGVWIAWLPSETVVEQVEVELAVAGPLTLEIGRPRAADGATDPVDGAPIDRQQRSGVG